MRYSVLVRTDICIQVSYDFDIFNMVFEEKKTRILQANKTIHIQ